MARLAAQNERNASSTSNIDAWWAPATKEAPEDAYKRLIDACRLAVEEAYTTQGDIIGSYAEGAGGDDGASMRFFNDFLSTASRLGLMPPWWTSADDTAVKKLAKKLLHHARAGGVGREGDLGRCDHAGAAVACKPRLRRLHRGWWLLRLQRR